MGGLQSPARVSGVKGNGEQGPGRARGNHVHSLPQPALPGRSWQSPAGQGWSQEASRARTLGYFAPAFLGSSPQTLASPPKVARGI